MVYSFARIGAALTMRVVAGDVQKNGDGGSPSGVLNMVATANMGLVISSEIDSPGPITVAGGLVSLDAGNMITGGITIESGMLALGAAKAEDASAIPFDGAGSSAVLRVDRDSAELSGGTLAASLLNFYATTARLDLTGCADAPGQTSATLSGQTLNVMNGMQTDVFTLVGAIAGQYETVSDGAGGPWS